MRACIAARSHGSETRLLFHLDSTYKVRGTLIGVFVHGTYGLDSQPRAKNINNSEQRQKKFGMRGRFVLAHANCQ